jgi:CRP-like cAMP-binding protein
MFSSEPYQRNGENRLLSQVPADELQRLRADLQAVTLGPGQVVFEADRPAEFVYFVDQGMISIVSLMEDGASIEVATIGQEGLAGWPAVLGAPSLPFRYNVQVAGRARRMSVAALARLLWHESAFRTLLFRYHAAFVTQVMQSVACNGLHSVEQRCCRWLLSAHDRIGTPELAITHDALAQMLGVRRASISDVLRPLQDKGLIRAARGKVTILAPERLAASSCECYRIIRGEYQRLLG